MGCVQAKKDAAPPAKAISIDKPTGQKHVVDGVINKIWGEYDTDNNGYLDPDEVK